MPRLAPGWETRAANLSPEEGFLLSRIDGSTSWGMLRTIAGMRPEQVDRCVTRWLEEGLVTLVDAPGARARAGRADAVAPDPSIDLPEELQRRILEFEGSLDRPYHQILGVERDADARTIKRAYFRLSRDFHPDRYFRREIGHFAARLDRIFKKVALAYELLIDPATRAEVERCAMELESQDPPAEAPPGTPREHTKRDWLRHMRRQFRIPQQILAERRLKARQFADAARVAEHQCHWNEAASCIRLAIAFDPWTDDYKDAFATVQAHVNQQRAEQLLEEAGGAWDSRSGQEALSLFEEAMTYRPSDPAIHDRAARVAIELEDHEKACEYAERACELEPDCAAYHLTLGRALRMEGRRERARSVLQHARDLDPNDPAIRQELSRVQQRPGRSSGGMQ